MFIQPFLYIYTPLDISSKTHLTHSVEMVLERVQKKRLAVHKWGTGSRTIVC